MNLKEFNFYGAIVSSSWLLFLMIVATEFSPEFKALLTSVLFHHWIAKAVLTTVLFLIVGFCMKDSCNDEKLAYNSSVAVSALIILFYIFHYIFF